LQLTGDRRREIRLDAGKIWMNIKKSGAGMRIITPGAVAAVTGTELMVEFDQAKQTTEVTVFEGAVNVTGDVGDLVKVTAGTTSRVPFNAPALAPTPVDNSKLQERSRLYKPLSVEPTSPEASTGPTTSGSPAPTVTVGTPDSPAASTGPDAAAKQPDMKEQQQFINNPRVIGGSPTRGSVKVIVQ